MATRKKPTLVDTPLPREVKQGYTKTIFPKPEAYKMSSQTFEKWLCSFPAEARPRVTLSFYRDFPRINLKQIPGEQYERRIFFYESSLDADQRVFRDDFNLRTFVLHNEEWGGEGEYRVLCNEQGVKGAIGMTEFTLEDPDYPPRVDLRAVVQGWPRNQGFIRSLRAKGVRLPGDNPALDEAEQQEQDDMNIAHQVSELAQPLIQDTLRRNERLEERLETVTEQIRESRQGPSAESVATNKGIEVMAQATGKAMDMVTDQARAIAIAAAPTYNPVELFKTGLEAGNSGKNDNSLAIAQLFVSSNEKALAQIRDMHHETMETVTKLLESREQEPEASPAREAGAMDEFDREFERVQRFAKLFGWERTPRLENAAPAAKEPGLFDKVGKFLAENPMMALAGLGLLANIVYNFRSATPVSPQAALEAAGVPKGALPPLPGQPEQAAPQPPAPNQAQANLNNFLEFLTPHFLAHYNDTSKQGYDGYTFAADLHTMVETPSGTQLVPGTPATVLGRQQYENLVKAGPEMFDRLIRNWPPIWSVISKNPTTPSDPQHYAKFFAEFFSYDQYAKKEAGIQ